MAEVILMPRLSDTMTEGVIAAWHKKVGDTVKKGDLLAEIETDKATMELESYQDGILLHIGTPRGGKLQVNDLLAIFGKQGEDVSALITQHTNASASVTAATNNEPAAATTTTASAPTAANSDVLNSDEIVLMPRLSDTMTEGVIAGWQKKVGDAVKKGEVLADIETDKATMELESYKDGILLYQGAQAGEKILVNQLLCIIGQPGIDIDAMVNAVKASTDAPAAVAAPSIATPTTTPTTTPTGSGSTSNSKSPVNSLSRTSTSNSLISATVTSIPGQQIGANQQAALTSPTALSPSNLGAIIGTTLGVIIIIALASLVLKDRLTGIKGFGLARSPVTSQTMVVSNPSFTSGFSLNEIQTYSHPTHNQSSQV